MVHVEEETLGTRLIVNTLTCLLSKEADPSRLVASSPGKLVRHLVPSGSHVGQNQVRSLGNPSYESPLLSGCC